MHKIKMAGFKKKYVFGSLFVGGLLLAGLLALLALHNRNQQVQTYAIDQSEFDREFNKYEQFFTVSEQDADRSTLARDVRTQLLDKIVIAEHAATNGISVKPEQVDAYYQQRVDNYGSEEKLLREVERLYDTDKQQYKKSIHDDLLREAVQSNLSSPLNSWLADRRSQSELLINE